MLYCLFLQAQQPMTSEPNYTLIAIIISIAGVFAAVFRFGRASVSKDDLDAAKEELNDKISQKVDKDVFEEFQAQVWDQAQKHEAVNELTYKLIREDMKEYRKEQVENAKMLNEINTNLRIAINDIKWLRTNTNKQ